MASGPHMTCFATLQARLFDPGKSPDSAVRCEPQWPMTNKNASISLTEARAIADQWQAQRDDYDRMPQAD